jgi:hypothetical protein
MGWLSHAMKRETEQPRSCLLWHSRLEVRGSEVSGLNEPRDAHFEEANSQLVAGLKSCRSVVDNYRAMLAGEQGEPIADVSGNDAESGETFE